MFPPPLQWSWPFLFTFFLLTFTLELFLHFLCFFCLLIVLLAHVSNPKSGCVFFFFFLLLLSAPVLFLFLSFHRCHQTFLPPPFKTPASFSLSDYYPRIPKLPSKAHVLVGPHTAPVLRSFIPIFSPTQFLICLVFPDPSPFSLVYLCASWPVCVPPLSFQVFSFFFFWGIFLIFFSFPPLPPTGGRSGPSPRLFLNHIPPSRRPFFLSSPSPRHSSAHKASWTRFPFPHWLPLPCLVSSFPTSPPPPAWRPGFPGFYVCWVLFTQTSFCKALFDERDCSFSFPHG